MNHIVNRYSRKVNWQKEQHGSHCTPILQNGKLTERVYNVIHAALSVSFPFWSIGLQCDPCSSFCQFSVLEYLFTMWSMLLFLSVYRSGVSVYNVIHAALSVSLALWSICLQCDPCSSFCQFTVLEYRFTMWSTHCKLILQNGKLTERAAWITL
jgi:hypothetical protein